MHRACQSVIDGAGQYFADLVPLRTRYCFPKSDQGKCHLALTDIGTERLSDSTIIAPQIQKVVSDLKSNAE
jgi:hypothetical protein